MALIDREELYKEICRAYEYEYPTASGAFDEFVSKTLKNIIYNAPTVDAEPVRHGHNENQEYHEVDEFRCSECGLHLEDWTRYVYDEDSDEKYAQEYVFKRCPECGAKIGVQ